MFSCLVAVRLGLGFAGLFGGFGVWVQDVTSYTKVTMLICDLAESEEALGWKLWFRHQK